MLNVIKVQSLIATLISYSHQPCFAHTTIIDTVMLECSPNVDLKL